jgi:hypothetical protein
MARPKGLVFGLAGAALLAFGQGTRADEPEAPAEDRVKLVRATYEKVPPTILRLKEPIRVEQCAHQRVPVVIGLVFKDADETTHHFSWWLDRGKFSNREFDKIDWSHYKGINSLGAKRFRLSVRSPEEAALYGLLLRWVAAKEKAKEATLFDKEMVKQVSKLLEKFDARFASDKPVLLTR